MTSRIYTTDRLEPAARLKTYDSGAAINSDVIVAFPVTLFKYVASNKAASGTLWLQFFDATAVPSLGAIPLFAPTPILFGTQAQVDLTVVSEGLHGLSTASGLVWAASTTAATLTADTTNSVWLSARFYL